MPLPEGRKMTQADVTAAFAARDAAMLLHIKGVLSANGGSYPDDVTLPQAKELLVEQLKTKLTQKDISHMTQQEYESETRVVSSYWMYLYDLLASVS